jgi:hypothetical protein
LIAYVHTVTHIPAHALNLKLLEVHKYIFIPLHNMHHLAITFITTIETTLNIFSAHTFIHYHCLDFMHRCTI